MNFAGCIPRFLKAHGSLILTILSGVGLVATVVETAKVAPEAKKDLQEELHWQTHFRVDELMEEAEANGHDPDNWTDDEHAELYDRAEQETKLTIWDKIDVAGPHYIPVILLGLGTMACMAGAHILSVKQQASLLAAYGLLQRQFSAYRGEIREKYGEEADHEAYILSQKRIECLQNEIEQLKKLKGYATFGIATAPGLIFRANMAQIENAFLHFNRNLTIRGFGTVSELHDFIGLPIDNPMVAPITPPDEDYGWNEYMNEVNYGITVVDFIIQDVTAEDGEIIHVIVPTIPPYRNDAEDENNVQRYDPFDVNRACELAKYGWSGAVMRYEVDPEHYCWVNGYGGCFA